MISKSKQAYLGYMVNKLLNGIRGKLDVDDRDNYANKRIDVSGILIAKLFNQLFAKMCDIMKNNLIKESSTRLFKQHELQTLIPRIIKSSIIEQGFKTSLSTGNWTVQKSATPHVTTQGVAQVLGRKSYLELISHLRRVVTPQNKDVKLVDSRLLQNTHWGVLCPAETPEGSAVGLTKNLTLLADVTSISASEPVIEYLNALETRDGKDTVMISIDKMQPSRIGYYTKILVNGNWIGCSNDPVHIIFKLRDARRKLILNSEIGIVFDDKMNEILVNTDHGRAIRPLFIVDKGNKLRVTKEHISKIKNGEIGWEDLLKPTQGETVIEYIDVHESMMNCLIAMRLEDLEKNKDYEYTHCEINPAMLLGIAASVIPFPDHNQSPRNTYQSAMGKQAIGVYATNFRHRMDTMAHVLNYPQVPLVFPRSMKFMNIEKLPSGQNACVAILSYTGYNQEDSVIMNQSAIDRGLFRSTYYKTYKEDQKKNEEKFMKPDAHTTAGMKRYGSYEHLEDAFVPPNTPVKLNDIIIGKVQKIEKTEKSSIIEYKDISVTLKEKFRYY